MVGEDFAQQLVATLLVKIDDGVVQGVLVLFQPTGDVVWYLEEIQSCQFIISLHKTKIYLHYQRSDPV